MTLFVAMVGVLATMVLALARAFLGPQLYDRILAINMFGTKTVIFVALVGFLMGRPQFLDIAVFYALVNFVGTVAVLKLSHYRELDAVKSEEEVR
ncbi:MAG: monovalent cation/H+ antiporter complex subunit F [Actinomycetota bacterium]|nr:monovalent cation/H+ antiporter complex subunit F [Actinomycetota bacterium]